MITKRKVEVELAFVGSGRVVEVGPGHFSGAVPEPDFGGEVAVEVWREAVDDSGLWNPVPGEGPFPGGLQISITGTREGYRRLGIHLLALAELDTTADPGFHQHTEFITADGATHLNLILRKHG
jgi:hypothetical protein